MTKLNSREKPKVLVVGTEPDMQEFITNVLQEKYEVAMVAQGIEALTHLIKHSVNLIITNALIPEMHGCTFIDVLRQSKTHHTVPIILLTTSKDQINRLKFINIGLDDYLSQPFTEKELLTRAQVMLRRAKVKTSS